MHTKILFTEKVGEPWPPRFCLIALIHVLVYYFIWQRVYYFIWWRIISNIDWLSFQDHFCNRHQRETMQIGESQGDSNLPTRA